MNYNEKFIKLGNNGLKVSKLGFGCLALSGIYGKTTEKESFNILLKAYELGINHFDTADMYGDGENEILLGKVIKNFDRNKIVIATKCGIVRDKISNTVTGVNGTPEYIKKSCEASLLRLGVDYIDLLYLHRPDPNTPIEVTIEAMSELVKEGKVANIGLSGVKANTICRAHSIYPLTAIQSEYSIWTRNQEEEVIPLCKSLNIGFVAYSPLGIGFLAGKINSIDQFEETDFRRISPRFQAENIVHNLSVVRVVESIAKDRGCMPSQIALSWILSQGDNITAIPGTRQIKHLEENMRALDIQLSNDELSKLNNQIPVGFARGNLYPDAFEKFAE
ncbi:MAG: aldo/keto reductase [Neisseriaceae bacterium]